MPSDRECAQALREVRWAVGCGPHMPLLNLRVVERDGSVRLIPMADVAARMVLRRLFKDFNLEDVEAFYTDEYPAYNALRSLSLHETVNHSIGEYAKSGVHTNTVEGEFSVFRPWNATFRGHSRKTSTSIRLTMTSYATTAT